MCNRLTLSLPIGEGRDGAKNKLYDKKTLHSTLNKYGRNRTLTDACYEWSGN